MSLCFIEPQDAIRVIAESVGREARRQILGEVVRAWVDEIPESELESHYAKALADLDEHDLSLLAAWHASLEVGHPLPNREFLVNVFPSLGDHRREALKIAAGFRGEEAFEAGVGEDQAFDTVLPWLSEARCVELAKECLELYCWDRLGVETDPARSPRSGRYRRRARTRHRTLARRRRRDGSIPQRLDSPSTTTRPWPPASRGCAGRRLAGSKPDPGVGDLDADAVAVGGDPQPDRRRRPSARDGSRRS